MTNITKPTPKTNTYIKALVDSYMDGTTTNEEEATLRQWFRSAGDSVPDEWKPLRAMLAFVDSERNIFSIQGDCQDTPLSEETIQPAMLNDTPAHKRRLLQRSRLWISVAVASAAAALLLLVPHIGGGAEPQSYVVIDGKVYTNPKVVREQAMDALHTISAEADDPFCALDMML